MATSIWDVDGHRVCLTHGFCLGAATITVDDQIVFERPRNIIDFGFAHRFEIEGTPVAVQVFSDGIWFRHQILSGSDAELVEESNALPLEHVLRSVAIFAAAAGLLIMGFAFSAIWILRG